MYSLELMIKEGLKSCLESLCMYVAVEDRGGMWQSERIAASVPASVWLDVNF